jgi:hypothetical protein
MPALVKGLYNDQSIQQWQNERTMLHSSGIWGRKPVLEYLADESSRPATLSSTWVLGQDTRPCGSRK